MRLLGCAVLSLLLVCGASWGSETAQYVSGAEGIKAGSLPPPGIWYRAYQLYYHAGTLKDEKGHDTRLPNGEKLDFKADVVASVQRAIWVTDMTQKALGCDWAVHAVVPVVYTDLRIKQAGVDDTRIRVGDVYVSPAIFAWHKQRFDLVVDYETIIPTGDVHTGESANPGRDYWTHMFTFGGTGYLDEKKTWTFSLLSRYEINSEKKNAHYRPGDQFHFEWGAGKAIPSVGVEVGVAGYCGWQVTDDTGHGVTWKRSVHDRIFAAGPEVNYMIKPIMLHMTARYQKEFCARDHTEGHFALLLFTKRF